MINVLLILIMLIGNYEQQEPYDYVPTVEEYISPTEWEEQAQLIHVTCYYSSPTAHTYSGQIVHDGGCASNKANLGKIACLYTKDRQVVGFYECNDIGGATSLRNGTSIDIWQKDLDSCWDFINTYGDELYVIWIDADG